MSDEGHSLERLLASVRGPFDPALPTEDPGRLAATLSRLLTTRPDGEGGDAAPHRWQDAVIEDHVPAGSSVLDLGCGAGDLLRRLICDKEVRAQGVELDPDAVLTCLRRCIPVIQADIDQGLKGFEDSTIDYVILEETLQALHRPREILNEMLRVGRTGVVSFPNFGFWNVRLQLGLRGRMPVTPGLPHQWYDTPNIHLLTLGDFVDWTEGEGASIVQGYALADGEVRPLTLPDDNLLAEQVLLFVERPPPA